MSQIAVEKSHPNSARGIGCDSTSARHLRLRIEVLHGQPTNADQCSGRSYDLNPDVVLYIFSDSRDKAYRIAVLSFNSTKYAVFVDRQGIVDANP